MNETGFTPRRHGIAGPLILALGLMGAAFILGASAIRIANSRNTIDVTGSAKQQIRSDWAIWAGSYSSRSTNLQSAYADLESASAKVRTYLVSKGIAEGEMTFHPVETQTIQQTDSHGRGANNVAGYRLSQVVTVESADVERITRISREASELIRQGVPFESQSPAFIYTKLADLKVDMLARATKDAKARAEEVARNSGSRIGRLRDARMGVFQITPAHSTEVSDYGENDTASLMKDITAVVSVSFEIR